MSVEFNVCFLKIKWQKGIKSQQAGKGEIEQTSALIYCFGNFFREGVDGERGKGKHKARLEEKNLFI